MSVLYICENVIALRVHISNGHNDALEIARKRRRMMSVGENTASNAREGIKKQICWLGAVQ